MNTETTTQTKATKQEEEEEKHIQFKNSYAKTLQTI